MAKPGAVIHIVVTKAPPDQLLEQICLFIGAFGRAESSHCLAPLIPESGQAIRGHI